MGNKRSPKSRSGLSSPREEYGPDFADESHQLEPSPEGRLSWDGDMRSQGEDGRGERIQAKLKLLREGAPCHRRRKQILNWPSLIDVALKYADEDQRCMKHFRLCGPELRAWVEDKKQVLYYEHTRYGADDWDIMVLGLFIAQRLTSRFLKDETVGIAYMEYRRSLPAVVKSLYDKYKEQQTQPTLEELRSALLSVFSLHSGVFIMIQCYRIERTADLKGIISDFRGVQASSRILTDSVTPHVDRRRIPTR
ncbi:hypothetical protein F5Y11DRAFT_367247 [Daldinia sp. FL1419]|nr:hypothetical protein F5Y11DRAFT_367247 [Daldinia sp. FL1419]